MSSPKNQKDPQKQSLLNPPPINSSQILLLDESPSELTYFLPCYLRLKIQNITNIDVSNSAAKLNCNIIFSVYYGELPKNIVQRLYNQILLHFNRSQSIVLQQTLQISMKDDIKQKMITFILRKNLNVKIHSQTFLTPFQITQLVMSITVNTIKIPSFNNQPYTKVSFNCMENCQLGSFMSHSLDCSFGNYQLAKSQLKGEYSARKVYSQNLQIIALQNSEISPSKLQYFQYSHFIIPLFHHPQPSLISIFMPLWLLGLLNLTIFFTNPELEQRVASIATIMIAFISFIPVVQSQLVPSKKFTLVQILLYLQVFTCLICLLDSFMIQSISPTKYKFRWRKDKLYLLALLINIVSIGLVVTLYCFHKFVWQVQYNKCEIKEKKFRKEDWVHRKCDDEILRYNRVSQVKVVRYC